MTTEPICFDLYCGMGGWAEGFLAEGWRVIGFDIERWSYPGQLVLQDVLTVHGSQCRYASCIVASPPCTEPSYRAMPWSRAKALNAAGPPIKFIELFEACFRIQREATEAAGHYIPMVVENVKGAQPWVGSARWHFGSYYLWGDVPAIMPIAGGKKNNGSGTWFAIGSPGQKQTCGNPVNGIKQHGSGQVWFDRGVASLPSGSSRRKQASALIAKIPFPLAQYIARVYKPQIQETR